MFVSLVEVQATIKRFSAQTNGSPRPFVWTADPDRIIKAGKRGHQALDSGDYRIAYGRTSRLTKAAMTSR